MIKSKDSKQIKHLKKLKMKKYRDLHEEFIVFVEVKTRTSREWGDPEDFIGAAKIRRLVNAADLYLKFYDIDKPVRFDIISAVWDGVRFEMEHIDDAFMSPVF